MKLQTMLLDADAIEWVGQHLATDDSPEGFNGIEYVLDFVGEDNARLSGHGLRVLTHGGWVLVVEGDWIIKTPGAGLLVMHDDAMRVLFREVAG